tara:strand:+ start:768 stop:1619 length:852 start_codon:yes stop_codon:yes gene_type:complete
MAVKPITNPLPLQGESINRGKQISSRDNANKSSNISNREQMVIPGSKSSDNYEINIKDLDTSIINHIKRVMKLKVNHNNEMIDVPVMYGNEERWANYRKRGYVRDRNGSLVLPLLMLKRTTINMNETLPNWKHDLTGDNIELIRSSKWSKDNQYTKFNIQTGVKPVEERIVTGYPQYVNATYDFVVWTQYMTQMNSVLEVFVDQHQRYWGDNTSYRFLCKIDGGLQDASEISANGERLLRHSFVVTLNGYLIPELVSNIINKQRFNAKKTLTKKQLVFSEKIQ